MGMKTAYILKWGCFVCILASTLLTFLFVYEGEWFGAFVWFAIWVNSLIQYATMRESIREQTALDEELERLKNDYRS